MKKEEIEVQGSISDEQVKMAILNKAWTVFVQQLSSDGRLAGKRLTCNIEITCSSGEYSGIVTVATEDKNASFNITYDGLVYDFVLQNVSQDPSVIVSHLITTLAA